MPLSHMEAASRRRNLLLVCTLAAAELFIISVIYQHNFNFTCRDAVPEVFCAFAGRIVPRVLGAIAVIILFSLAKWSELKPLFSRPPEMSKALFLNLASFLLILLPSQIVSDQSSGAIVAFGAACWVLGGIGAAAGLAGLIAPVDAWRELWRRHGLLILPLLALGMAVPELTQSLYSLWRVDFLTSVTFDAVASLLRSIGYEIYSDPATRIIGTNEFAVGVGPQCSGIEGFVLITVFMTLYLFLFRDDLRWPHVLLLYPLGIVVSWAFNVLRITVLLIMGLEGSPELAVGGFHSHAGWLAFTILSLGLIGLSRSVGFFRRQGQPSRAASPFWSDPAVVQILPFAVFMASALLSSTVSEMPSLVYPWRFAAMALVLFLVRRALLSLPWRFDLYALFAGLVVGALWLATSPPSDAPPPFGTLTGAALAVWMITRLLGTTLLVPIIEELFFRGYLLNRIAPSRQGWPMVAGVIVSSVLFALLHDRWLAAGLAGVVFGLLVWRSGRVTDAIIAHAVANGTIAIWALVMQSWHVF